MASENRWRETSQILQCEDETCRHAYTVRGSEAWQDHILHGEGPENRYETLENRTPRLKHFLCIQVTRTDEKVPPLEI